MSTRSLLKALRRAGLVLLVAALAAAAGAGCRGPAFMLGSDAEHPGSCEPVDGARVGDDCDGVFVAWNALVGDGSREAPFRTIGAALAEGAHTIYVCGPSYREDLTVPKGTVLYGGIDCDTWAFDLAARTEITGIAGSIPMRLEGGTGTHIEGFRIVAADAEASAGSSIALVANEVTVRLRRVDLVAGDAMPGEAGGSGAPGDDGDPGQDASGSTGAFGAASGCGADGGKGGSGVSGGAAGSPGEPAQSNGGAAGCQGGGLGDNGSAGSAGANSSGIGTLALDGYLPPPAGAQGDVGQAAGGGGGGGGVTGHGGGGGGSGGCGGQGGLPGSSGGSSIAVVALHAAIVFDSSTAVTGRGGNGGVGGPGGGGGNPGASGNGDVGACAGGNGGAGGAGGPGGGGAGGHSVIIAFIGSEPDLTGLDFEAPADALAGRGEGSAPTTDGLAQPSLELEP